MSSAGKKKDDETMKLIIKEKRSFLEKEIETLTNVTEESLIKFLDPITKKYGWTKTVEKINPNSYSKHADIVYRSRKNYVIRLGKGEFTVLDKGPHLGELYSFSYRRDKNLVVTYYYYPDNGYASLSFDTKTKHKSVSLAR